MQWQKLGKGPTEGWYSGIFKIVEYHYYRSHRCDPYYLPFYLVDGDKNWGMAVPKREFLQGNFGWEEDYVDRKLDKVHSLEAAQAMCEDYAKRGFTKLQLDTAGGIIKRLSACEVNHAHQP